MEQLGTKVTIHTTDGFYQELERVLDQLPKYYVKILLRDFNVNVGREGIFKPTIVNASLHDISNDNEVRVAYYATSRNLLRVPCSHIAAFINTLGLLLMRKCTIRLITPR